jgi:hypothetical protein
MGSKQPAVDEGWTELDTMSLLKKLLTREEKGYMINPELYIGVGLSGELQPMVGIAGERLWLRSKITGNPQFLSR